MRAVKALLAGVVGGAAMSLLLWMSRTMMDMPANLEMMLLHAVYGSVVGAIYPSVEHPGGRPIVASNAQRI